MWVLHFPLPWKIMVCKNYEDIMFLLSLTIVVLLTIKQDHDKSVSNMAKGRRTLETCL
jgi:hypothetical protein